MLFEEVKSSSRERLAEVQQLLNHITSLEPDDVTTPHSAEVKILRGFFYVHLYAALEKSINETVQLTLRLVASDNTPGKNYKLSFGTIAAHTKLQAFKDCGSKTYSDNVFNIFSCLESDGATHIDEFQFSDTLMNVWTKSIIEVFRSFGISSFIVAPRVRTTIDELVENRNKVAHGRESPLTVGERHRSTILRDKFAIITTLIDSVIDHLENFYNSKGFLKAI